MAGKTAKEVFDMKNKKRLFLGGTLIIGMAFSLVLAGCASTTAAEDPTAVELAAQLAADLNAIEAESATVNGAMVTLTGRFVEIASDLIVPAGVTLDVTAHGAALGLHNATLTVNGTVNTTFDFGDSWEAPSIRLEDSASWAIINGSGTIYLKDKGRLLEVGGNINVANRKLTLDGVTLVGLKGNDSRVVEIGNGGEFVMKSGMITGNIGEGAGGGGVGVWAEGTFTMKGGAISGNSAHGNEGGEGGGVTVHEGTFAMEGGTISGNSAIGEAWGAGGGVHLSGSVFTMTGGEISGNTAQGGNEARGGGVAVSGEDTFIMLGGTISGNTAQGGEGASGGGVQIGEESVFTMKNGAITGNNVTGNERASGGGVDMDKGTFTMEGGTISGNSVNGNRVFGGGVNADGEGSVFTLKGGTIYGSSAGGGNANTTVDTDDSAALNVALGVTAKWGTGGVYTKGGVSQPGDSDISNTNDTLIATPAE
jgi:hypothetical protein